MTLKLRQRAIRNFIASLLMSDMTAVEIRQLAKELRQGSFGEELGRLVHELAELTDFSSRENMRPDKLRREENASRKLDSRRDIALETIYRRRMTKRMVSELMKLASPRLDVNNFASGGASLKEQVDRYLDTVPDKEIDRFLTLLGGGEIDPYLKGISQRD
jgi:hypothetical protein